MPYKVITGIYIIKNLVTNKVYIGSSKSVFKRISAHKNQLLNNKHFSSHLQSSYNKYGLNNFTFELLEIVDLDKKLLQEREEYHIKYFNSNNRLYGYNKRINCETNLGIKLSKEHCEKLRISHLGHKRSKEAHKKILQSQYKKVFKIGKDKNIIEEYYSIKDAGIKNNIHVANISACCRGKINSTGGFNWCFVEDYDKVKFKEIKSFNKHTKWIYENIETGEKYNKLKDVSILLNIVSPILSNMFSDNIKNITKFIRYKETYE